MSNEKTSRDALGDRMKKYEANQSELAFDLALPVYARIDGRCFSRYTKDLGHPYDREFSDIMVEVTKYLVSETGACVGHTQSDEISLSWFGNVFFEGKILKMTSVLSSLTTAKFCQLALPKYPSKPLPSFDCRVFQLPSVTELSNVFLWRDLDATKNAVSMATRHYYTTSQMYGKNTEQMIQMLQKKGVEFNSYPAFFRKGTWCNKTIEEKVMSDEAYYSIPGKHGIPRDYKVKRRVIQTYYIENYRELSLEDRINHVLGK